MSRSKNDNFLMQSKVTEFQDIVFHYGLKLFVEFLCMDYGNLQSWECIGVVLSGSGRPRNFLTHKMPDAHKIRSLRQQQPRLRNKNRNDPSTGDSPDEGNPFTELTACIRPHEVSKQCPAQINDRGAPSQTCITLNSRVLRDVVIQQAGSRGVFPLQCEA